MADLTISAKDREKLRWLDSQIAELAARPIEMRIIRNAKKPVMMIKPLDAGRLLPHEKSHRPC